MPVHVGEKRETHCKFVPLAKRLVHLILARFVVGEGRESLKTCDSSVLWEYLHFKKTNSLLDTVSKPLFYNVKQGRGTSSSTLPPRRFLMVNIFVLYVYEEF